MSSLEEAYSIEYGDTIDPELAYDLFWAGVIKDKKAFSCPSDVCNAKVTCINLDKEMQNMQQSPHFRGYNHDDECDATTDSSSSKDKLSDEDQTKSKTKKSNSIPDRFYVKRPAGQFAKKNEENTPSKNINLKKSKTSQNTSTVQSGSEHYSVRSLVSKFIRYKKEDALENHSVEISGRVISYKKLFKGVYGQSVEDLQENEYIYWGIAFIDYYPNKKCYRINFKESLRHEDETLRPSFFINQSMIDEYPVRNLVIKQLERIIKNKAKRVMVFLLSKPNTTESSGKTYINFEFSNLDYLEIREPDQFFENYAKCAIKT